MMTRIYTEPNTNINDAWNFDEKINSSPSETYCDDLIDGKPYRHTNGGTLYCEFYKNFAIDIVTETVFSYPHTQITNKTLRPILNKKMFILVAPAGTLSMLHDFGFKTFGDFINEDYDLMQDPCERMQAIIDELVRISKFSIDEIQKIVLQYKSKLQHNYDHYTWLCDNEIDQIVSKICLN